MSDLNDWEYPERLLPNELAELTIKKAGAVLLNATNATIPDRSFYIDIMNSAAEAANGNIEACCSIAEMLFDNEKLPQLFDPEMVYHWRLQALLTLDEENWIALRGMPGHSQESVCNYCGMMWAESTGMIGGPKEKQNAVKQVRRYVDTYRGEDFLCTDRLIYLMLGMPPSKAARQLGHQLTDMPVDRELAIFYYKQMIDDLIAKGYEDSARYQAREFEELLGIRYLERVAKRTAKTRPEGTGAVDLARKRPTFLLPLGIVILVLGLICHGMIVARCNSLTNLLGETTGEASLRELIAEIREASPQGYGISIMGVSPSEATMLTAAFACRYAAIAIGAVLTLAGLGLRLGRKKEAMSAASAHLSEKQSTTVSAGPEKHVYVRKEPELKRSCPNCHAPLGEVDRFCTMCGTAMQESESGPGPASKPEKRRGKDAKVITEVPERRSPGAHMKHSGGF